MEIRTSLAEWRTRRALSAAQLASIIGVTRQTIYAIEAGTYIPNTSVSLKLAQALDTSVEDIFQMDSTGSRTDEIIEARLLGSAAELVPGQPLQLCLVDGQTIAVASESTGQELPLADAVLLHQSRREKQGAIARVKVLSDQWRKTPRLLIAGCDPSASLLSRALLRLGCELVVAYENSSRAMGLLEESLVHMAGTHLLDAMDGRVDLSAITKAIGRRSVAVISYAVWEEGLVVAHGNPKRITGVADLVRKDVRFSNRESGAGCRRLLDELLAEQSIAPRQVHGYDRVTVGHLPSARLVRRGEVDCCISTRAVARALALDFIPLAKKPYYLVMRRSQLNHPGVQQMIELLARASYRREVETCTGYDMRIAGGRIL